MKYKRLNNIILVVGIIISALLIAWAIFSCKMSKWWQIDFKEWVPIFLGFEGVFVVSYYFTNKHINHEKRIEIYIHLIVKTQEALHEDCAHLFTPTTNFDATKKINFYAQKILLYFRRLKNSLDLLLRYRDDFPVEQELNFVKKQLDDYNELYTENIADIPGLQEKRTKIQSYIDLIDNKLDEIKLKLYQL